MDGASNNFTMMAHLETLLESRSIHFDAHDRQIICYAHCINLASKAAIGKLPNEALLNKDDDAILRNPIMLARAELLSYLPPCPPRSTSPPLPLRDPLQPILPPKIRRGGPSLKGFILGVSNFRCSTSSTSSVVVGSSQGPTSWPMSSLPKRQRTEISPGLSSLPNTTLTWSSALLHLYLTLFRR
jgi:hypothetical protein